MAKTKRIFLSDIHLGTKQLYEKAVARYNPDKHRTRLVNFIQNNVLAKADQMKDVVLLGDIFDTWTCLPDLEPPTYKKMFEDNPEEMQVFKGIVEKGINLFYVHGNHDFDLNPSELETAIPGIRVIRSYLGAGRSHAEHGHHHTLFSEIDFFSDPAFGRPIGYFVARAATKTHHRGSSLSDIISYLDDVIEVALTPQTLASSIIEAITERAGMNDNSTFTMPRRANAPPDASLPTVTVREVKARYAAFADRYGTSELRKRIYDELTKLGRAADSLCKEHSYNVVVFGHTHKATLDKDSILTEDRIYANSGAWCEEEAHCVEIDKGPLSSTLRVRLHRVDMAGKIVDTKVEELKKG